MRGPALGLALAVIGGLPVVLPVVLPTGAQAQSNDRECDVWRSRDSITPPDDWFACRQDSDCGVTRDACGFPVAAHRRHLADMTDFSRCMGPVVNCIQMMPLDNRLRQGRCIRDRCQTVVITDGPTVSRDAMNRPIIYFSWDTNALRPRMTEPAPAATSHEPEPETAPPVAAEPDNPYPALGFDPDQPQPLRSRNEVLTKVPAGPDREAARTAMDWFEALMRCDVAKVRALSSEPMLLDYKDMTLDEFLAQSIRNGQCDTPDPDNYAVMAALVAPSLDPATGAPIGGAAGILDLGPGDRNVMLLIGDRLADGTVRPNEGMEIFVRYVPEGIYRIAGFWD